MDPNKIDSAPKPRVHGEEDNDSKEIDPEKFKKLLKVDESDEAQKRHKRQQAEEAEEEEETPDAEPTPPSGDFKSLLSEDESDMGIFKAEKTGETRQSPTSSKQVSSPFFSQANVSHGTEANFEEGDIDEKAQGYDTANLKEQAPQPKLGSPYNYEAPAQQPPPSQEEEPKEPSAPPQQQQQEPAQGQTSNISSSDNIGEESNIPSEPNDAKQTSQSPSSSSNQPTSKKKKEEEKVVAELTKAPTDHKEHKQDAQILNKSKLSQPLDQTIDQTADSKQNASPKPLEEPTKLTSTKHEKEIKEEPTPNESIQQNKEKDAPNKKETTQKPSSHTEESSHQKKEASSSDALEIKPQIEEEKQTEATAKKNELSPRESQTNKTKTSSDQLKDTPEKHTVEDGKTSKKSELTENSQPDKIKVKTDQPKNHLEKDNIGQRTTAKKETSHTPPSDKKEAAIDHPKPTANADQKSPPNPQKQTNNEQLPNKSKQIYKDEIKGKAKEQTSDEKPSTSPVARKVHSHETDKSSSDTLEGQPQQTKEKEPTQGISPTTGKKLSAKEKKQKKIAAILARPLPIEVNDFPVAAQAGEEAKVEGLDKNKRQTHTTDDLSDELASMPNMSQIDNIIPPVQPAEQTPLSKLSPETLELFEKMVGFITIHSETNKETTSVIVNMPGTKFDKSEIIIERFASAANSFNIQLKGNPEAVKTMNANIDNLAASFEASKLAFQVNIQRPILLPEYQVLSRKEEHQDQDDGEQQQKRKKRGG